MLKNLLWLIMNSALPKLIDNDSATANTVTQVNYSLLNKLYFCDCTSFELRPIFKKQWSRLSISIIIYEHLILTVVTFLLMVDSD